MDQPPFFIFLYQVRNNLRTTYLEQATKQVKLRLALEKIAELENIVPSDEDIEKEFETIAQQYQMSVENVKQYLRAEDISLDTAVGKAAELVKESAVIE